MPVSSRHRSTAACRLVAALLLSSPVAAGAGVLAHLPESVALRLQPYRDLIEPVVPAAPPAFDDPTQALVDSVDSFSRELGFPVDRGEAIRAAGVSETLAARLATVVMALLRCHLATASAIVDLSHRDVVAAARDGEVPPSLDSAKFTAVRLCAAPLRAAVALLELHFRSDAAAAEPPVSIDAWPVLRLEAGTSDEVYVHDYALLVDVGGNDTYANNAGANMMDLESGPGAPAPRSGPARGCNTGLPGLAPGKNCSPTAAVLIDLAGDDTYGVFETPDPAVDAICTADPVIRRTVTIGAAVAGVGILRDVSGDDRYNGRATTTGAGHVFGIGILSDGAGNDSYLAARNGEGFALVGGFGLLHDESGNDVYDWYMPSPLVPGAPNETPGAGGIADDNRVPCDNVSRFLQGAGNLNVGTAVGRDPTMNAPLGVLLDERRDDSYRGVMVPTYKATFGGGVPAGSQGFGSENGIGLFIDRGGFDRYAGVPDRANDTTVGAGEESTGSGRFVDEESE
jgi:hypothetical protein